MTEEHLWRVWKDLQSLESIRKWTKTLGLLSMFIFIWMGGVRGMGVGGAVGYVILHLSSTSTRICYHSKSSGRRGGSWVCDSLPYKHKCHKSEIRLFFLLVWKLQNSAAVKCYKWVWGNFRLFRFITFSRLLLAQAGKKKSLVCLFGKIETLLSFSLNSNYEEAVTSSNW